MPRAVQVIAATVLLWTASAPAVAGDQAHEREPRTIVVEVRDRGFEWTDAGIGALATLGLVAAGTGAWLLVRRGRP